MTELVLVHGRAQEALDPEGLKTEWLDAIARGLGGKALDPELTHFPYYGDTLFAIAHAQANIPPIGLMGPVDDPEEQSFTVEVVAEILRAAGLATSETPMGVLNWGFVQAALEKLDGVPGASTASILAFTHDVHVYLTNPGVRDLIEAGVRSALRPGTANVVVAHSLGSIVAYNLLAREGASIGLRIPLFLTIGSPLAVSAIKRRLSPMRFPSCVGRWFNAMDERDLVALYPLDAERGAFPVSGIENNTDLRNSTSNHHGARGYLENAVIANRIAEALAS